jgi:hypothetical protein
VFTLSMWLSNVSSDQHHGGGASFPVVLSPRSAAVPWTRDRHPQGRWCSARTACGTRVWWLEETPTRVLMQLALRCAFWAQAALTAEA